MESKTCKYCKIEKTSDKYYTIWSTGKYKIDWSACKDCRKVRAVESKKRRQSAATHCKTCKREFNDTLKLSSKGMCSSCYTNSLSKDGNCIDCGVRFNSGFTKQTEKSAGGRCRRCYTKWRETKLVYNCNDCGVDIPRGSLKGSCSVCIEQKKLQAVESYVAQTGERIGGVNKDLTKEDFELIRRLLVKYNNDMFHFIDTFRVVQLHELAFGHVQALDAKPPHIQVIIMLKQLKPLYKEYVQGKR